MVAPITSMMKTTAVMMPHRIIVDRKMAVTTQHQMTVNRMPAVTTQHPTMEVRTAVVITQHPTTGDRMAGVTMPHPMMEDQAVAVTMQHPMMVDRIPVVTIPHRMMGVRIALHAVTQQAMMTEQPSKAVKASRCEILMLSSCRGSMGPVSVDHFSDSFLPNFESWALPCCSLQLYRCPSKIKLHARLPNLKDSRRSWQPSVLR